ncbi:MAG TPA: hypothetical protein VKU86_01700 [Acidimicrobiales bacterium]|nr:hypothetical protein [Acidimicrobiales bacterium]
MRAEGRGAHGVGRPGPEDEAARPRPGRPATATRTPRRSPLLPAGALALFWNTYSHRASDVGGSDGFALLEVVVATMLLAVSLVGIGSVLGSQLLSIGNSTSQQVAGGLLNQAMEEVRAVPYQIVANGLSTSDTTIATDANISVTGTAPNQTYTFVPTGEQVPHGSLAYTQAPFVPHIATTTARGTTYTIAAYPTIDGAGTGVYRVTIMVSWHANAIGGVSRISAQTLVYSESSGCLTDTNHPFAAPCQPFFYAQGTAGTASGVTVTGTLLGVSFTDASLTLPRASDTMQIEQVSSVLGSVEASGGVIDTSGGPQAYGSSKASSAADNDPGSTTGTSQTNAFSQTGSSSSVSGSGPGANSITVASSWSDNGTTTSTASASSSPACHDLAGVTQATGLPCGSGSVTQSGTTTTIQAGLYAGSVSLLQAPLVSLTTGPSSTAGFVGRYTSPSGSYCASTSGDGCVHAGLQRSVGTLQLGGLPGQLLPGFDAVAPVGWGNSVSPNANCPTGNYMVALVNYADRVSTESGVNANRATTTMPTGSSTPYVCFWNGTGYTSQVLALGSTPQAISIPAVNVVDPGVAGGPVTVSLAAALSVGTATTSISTPSGCTTPCQSTATISSPIQGSVSFAVTQGATTIANLSVAVNLGELTASTSYQAAP